MTTYPARIKFYTIIIFMHKSISDHVLNILTFTMCLFLFLYLWEDIEDTKVVIRIRKSKNDRQSNGQEKKDKQRNMKHKYIIYRLELQTTAYHI